MRFMWFMLLLVLIVILFTGTACLRKACTSKGCYQNVILIVEEVFQEPTITIELDGETYFFEKDDSNVYIAENRYLQVTENETRIYLTPKKVRTPSILSITIQDIREGEIITHTLKNYELEIITHYPNGHHCQPTCYVATIQLDVEGTTLQPTPITPRFLQWS